MADESVRSLLATLGFEVDTTGADQFEARFKKLELTISGLVTKINSLKPPKLPDPKESGKTFGQKFKAAFLAALKIKNKDAFKGFTSSLKKGLDRSFKAAKIFAAAGAAALIGAAIKGSLSFIGVGRAELAIKFRVEKQKPGAFKQLIKDIEDIRTETEKVISRLESLNIYSALLETTGTIGRALPLLEPSIKFGKVKNVDPVSIANALGGFVRTGAVGPLENLNMFSNAVIEMLSRATSGFSEADASSRFNLILKKIDSGAAELDRFFSEYLDLPGATLDKLSALKEEGLNVVGKNVIEAGKDVVKSVTDVLNFDNIKSVKDRTMKFIGIGSGKKTTNSTSVRTQESTNITNINTFNMTGSPESNAKAIIKEIGIEKLHREVLQTTPIIANPPVSK